MPWRKTVVAGLLLLTACGDRASGAYVLIEPEDLGADHISEESVQAMIAGELVPPEYSSVPATSGPHAGGSTPCGIFRQEIPEIFNVHALEHGVVIFYYRPDQLSNDERAQLESLARELGTHVIVMPYTGLEETMALAAWGRLARLESFDLEAARAFWGEFAQLGPEEGVACDLTIDEGEG